MKLKKLNHAILTAACVGFAFSGTVAANDYRSYPMMYMTLPDTDQKTFNVAGLIEPTFTTSTSNKFMDGEDQQNNFSFDRLRFGFNGSYSEKTDFFFMSEWAKNAATKATGGGGNAFIAHATFKSDPNLFTAPLDLTLKEIEHKYASQVLDNLKGNKTQTARSLDIDYKTLINKLG